MWDSNDFVIYPSICHRLHKRLDEILSKQIELLAVYLGILP